MKKRSSAGGNCFSWVAQAPAPAPAPAAAIPVRPPPREPPSAGPDPPRAARRPHFRLAHGRSGSARGVPEGEPAARSDLPLDLRLMVFCWAGISSGRVHRPGPDICLAPISCPPDTGWRPPVLGHSGLFKARPASVGLSGFLFEGPHVSCWSKRTIVGTLPLALVPGIPQHTFSCFAKRQEWMPEKNRFLQVPAPKSR